MRAKDFFRPYKMENSAREACKAIRDNTPKVNAAKAKFREDEEASKAVLKANMDLSFMYLMYEDRCKQNGERPDSYEEFRAEAQRL